MKIISIPYKSCGLHKNHAESITKHIDSIQILNHAIEILRIQLKSHGFNKKTKWIS